MRHHHPPTKPRIEEFASKEIVAGPRQDEPHILGGVNLSRQTDHLQDVPPPCAGMDPTNRPWVRPPLRPVQSDRFNFPAGQVNTEIRRRRTETDNRARGFERAGRRSVMGCTTLDKFHHRLCPRGR